MRSTCTFGDRSDGHVSQFFRTSQCSSTRSIVDQGHGLGFFHHEHPLGPFGMEWQRFSLFVGWFFDRTNQVRLFPSVCSHDLCQPPPLPPSHGSIHALVVVRCKHACVGGSVTNSIMRPQGCPLVPLLQSPCHRMDGMESYPGKPRRRMPTTYHRGSHVEKGPCLASHPMERGIHVIGETDETRGNVTSTSDEGSQGGMRRTRTKRRKDIGISVSRGRSVRRSKRRRWKQR